MLEKAEMTKFAMNNEPIISFIVPIYNVEEFVYECLTSIVNQDVKNIEIICINDCTPDDSILKIEPLLDDGRFVLINNISNVGLAASRNIGLKAAKGKYVWFVDSDDRLAHKEAAGMLYEVAENNNADIVQFDTEYDFESDGLREAFGEFHRNSIETYTGCADGKTMLLHQLKCDDLFSMVQLQFYRRDFLINNDLFFPEVLHEDVYYTLVTMLKAKNVVYYPERLYRYLRRINSITTSGDNYMYRSYSLIHVVMDIISELKAVDLDAELSSCLSTYLFDRQNDAIKYYLKGLRSSETTTSTKVLDQFYLDFLLECRYPFVSKNINRQVCQKIFSSESIIIYGAGYISKIVELLLYDMDVHNYEIAVSKGDGIHRELQSFVPSDNLLLIIAVMKDKQTEMIKYAASLGFMNVLIVT